MENPELIIQPPSPTESTTQFNLLNFWETLEQKIEHSTKEDKLTPPKNPFHHHIHLNFCRKLVIIFNTIFILPLKILGICICIILSWFFSTLALAGVPLKKLSARRLSSSRRFGRRLAHFFLRCAFFCLGFLWVTVKGKRASPTEAPIMVVGPHTSLFDTLLLLAMGHPTASPVAKLSVHSIPLIGKMIDVTQPVYVQRDSSNSRRSAAREIRDRVKPFKESQDKADADPDGPDAADNNNPIREIWTQIFIFPEGTCANKKYLLKFKLGAFLPGVPVQPIIVRWPSKLDSTTWTFDGPQPFKLLWLTACQFFHRVHIQYLPVYKPSPAEVKDARLYSRNVQQLMSVASGLPTVDYTYEDGLLYMKIKYGTPLLKHLKKVKKFQFRYRVKKQPPPPNQEKNGFCDSSSSSDIDILSKLIQIFQRHSQSEPELHFTWSVSIPEFLKILNLKNLASSAGSSQEKKVEKKLFQLFSLYSNLNNNNHDINFKGHNNDELHREKAATVHSDIDIDIREYFIHLILLVYPKLSTDELATVIFALYGSKKNDLGGGEFPMMMDTSIMADTLRRVLYLPDDYVDTIMLGGFGLYSATSTNTNISTETSQNQMTNNNAAQGGIFDASAGGLLDDDASHDPDNVITLDEFKTKTRKVMEMIVFIGFEASGRLY